MIDTKPPRAMSSDIAAQGVHMVVAHVIGLMQMLDTDESRIHE